MARSAADLLTASTPPTSIERPSFLDGAGGLALLLIGAAVVFTAVADRPLTHSELRYVEAGREMLEGGDWIVPHLSYVPYFEKPILTYWLEAAAQALFGLGMVAVRAPFIVAAVAMTWTTYAFGRSMRGPRFGLGAAALLASSAMFQELGPAPMTDSLFSAFLAFAWYAFWRHDRAPKSAWIWAFWAALGFAVMTKGPLGLVLAGTTVGAYLFLAGRFRDFLATRPLRGAVVVVAINLPWWWLVGQRDPRYVWFFFVRQNFQAFFSGKVNHPGAPWYYLKLLPLVLFPFGLLGAWAICVETWGGIAPAARRLLGKTGTGVAVAADPWRLYLACMFVAPLAFLSVSASKLGTYLLPLFPAMALLAAAYVADRLARPTRMLRFATVAQAAALLAVAAAAPAVLNMLPAKWTDAARPLAGLLVFGAAAILLPMLAGAIAMARGRVVAGMTVVGAGAFVGILVANSVASAALVDAGGIVSRMKGVRKPDERVIVSGPCSDDYAIVMTLRERPIIWGTTRELGMGHFTEVTTPDVPLPLMPDGRGGTNDSYDIGGNIPLPQSPGLIDTRRLRAAWRGPARIWFVGRTEDVEWLRDNGFAITFFAEAADTSIATNLPLVGER